MKDDHYDLHGDPQIKAELQAVSKEPYHGIAKPKVPVNVVPEKRPEAVMPFIDSNPKTAFGAVKPGTFQTPPMPLYEYSLAHYQGALKYGHYNWREDPVSISTYINAARRHIDLFVEGQKDAADTSIHNLAHAMTCLSIVIDAEWYGTLIDDRGSMEIRGHDKLEEYFNASKERVTKITNDWTGHAQELKAKLAASKETKGDK